MRHKTISGAVSRLRQYTGYIGCACNPEVHWSRRAGAHRFGCARGDYLETIMELRRMTVPPTPKVKPRSKEGRGT